MRLDRGQGREDRDWLRRPDHLWVLPLLVLQVSPSEMSEPTTGTVEPTKEVETTQPEVVQKDELVPTTAEESNNDLVAVEPQNDITMKFTDAEWESIKELRVCNVALGQKAKLMPLSFRRNCRKLRRRSTDQRTLVLRSGVSN
jgi:hypothetical protein